MSTIVDVNVDLVDAIAADAGAPTIFVIGDPIAPGSVVTGATINADDSAEVGAVVQFGYSEGTVDGPAPVSLDVQLGSSDPATAPGGFDELNSGQVFSALNATIAVPITGTVQYPVIQVATNPLNDPVKYGAVHFKMEYISP